MVIFTSVTTTSSNINFQQMPEKKSAAKRSRQLKFLDLEKAYGLALMSKWWDPMRHHGVLRGQDQGKGCLGQSFQTLLEGSDDTGRLGYHAIPFSLYSSFLVTRPPRMSQVPFLGEVVVKYFLLVALFLL